MNNKSIIDDIQTVDWSNYETAYGNAHDVPNWLMDLLGDDAEKSMHASSNLWAGLCHQHAYLSSAAEPAYPFLKHALETATEPLRTELLDIFQGFASCSSPCHPNGNNPLEKHIRKQLLADTELFKRLMNDGDDSGFIQSILDELKTPYPRYLIKKHDAIIGYTFFEHGDAPMSIMHGHFTPTKNYNSQHANQHLTAWIDEEDRPFASKPLPFERIHIEYDESTEQSYINACTDSPETYKQYFPHHLERYQKQFADSSPFIIDTESVPLAEAAIRDILLLYTDMIESYDGFGHNLNTGTFNAVDFVNAELNEPKNTYLGINITLLNTGSAIALLCELLNAWDDHETWDVPNWPITAQIKQAFDQQRFGHLPLIQSSLEHCFNDNETAFRQSLNSVYQTHVLGYFKSLINN